VTNVPLHLWEGFSGATLQSNGVLFEGLDRKLSPLPESTEAPVHNPSLNLAMRFQVSGDFEINITATLTAANSTYFLFHGVIPMVQDEWYSAMSTFKAQIVNGDWCYWTMYHPDNTESGNAAASVGANVVYTFKREGTELVFLTNGVEVTRQSDMCLFADGVVYVSLDEVNVGATFLVTQITTTGSVEEMPVRSVPKTVGTLRDKAGKFRVGTAVSTYPMVFDEQYRAILGNEFNQITPENCMKFQFIQPARGVYDFYESDKLIDYAERNGIEVHGHTVAWNEATPQWLWDGWLNGTISASEVGEILDEHIERLFGRYKGRMVSFDVINEPFLGWTDQLRDSVWYQALGSGYIERALRKAHEVDPDVLLFINEWGCEEAGDKQDFLFNLVVELQTAGVPIHGIGLQMHEDVNADYQATWPRNTSSVTKADLKSAIARFKSLGIEVRVSELDINQYQNFADTSKAVADWYAQYLEACIEEGAHSFTMWGFTDRWSSLNEWYDYYNHGNGLIYDAQYRPKLSYQALSNTLDEMASSLSSL